jgi:Predicted membrane protein
MDKILKYLFLWVVGGTVYVGIELVYRGYSHWAMFVLGGICFICLGLINHAIEWTMPLWKQVSIGVIIVTVLEFIAGCIVNIWLDWEVWNYSMLPFNILGQICPQFIVLWFPVCLFGIVLDDWVRYLFFGEKRPYYKCFQS